MVSKQLFQLQIYFKIQVKIKWCSTAGEWKWSLLKNDSKFKRIQMGDDNEIYSFGDEKEDM